MFCEKCGDKVELNEAYCNKCGNFLGNRQQTQVQPTQTVAQQQPQVQQPTVQPMPVNQQAPVQHPPVEQPVQYMARNTSTAQQQVIQQASQATIVPIQQPQQNLYDNSNMFNNNVRSLNQQMINMNYNGQQPNQMNINVNNQVPQKNRNKKIKSMILGGLIGAVICGALAFVILTTFGDAVYITDNPYKEEQEEKKEEKQTKTKTVIIYDNKYTGVNISTKKDANALIVKDSVEQKSTCSKEIVAIEDNIIKNYGITAVNLCEMETDFAKEVGNVFKNIYEEYPEAKGYLTNLTLVNAPLSSGYIAAFQPIFTFATSSTDSTYPWVLKTQIYLNTSYFLNKDRLKSSVESGASSGHFPKNATIYSPVAHEMGHYLSFLAMMNNYDVDSILIIEDNDTDALYKLIEDFGKGTFSYKMIEEAYNNFKKEVGTTLNIDDWRGTISSYAVAKDNSGNYIYDETIAEAFHDVYLNGDEAAQASKYVVAVLKDKLKKKEA